MTSGIDDIARVLDLALDTLRKTAPNDLGKTMEFVAQLGARPFPPGPLVKLAEHLQTCGPNDRVLHALTLALQTWDHESEAAWTAGTVKHTEERRRLVLDILGFMPDQQQAINRRVLRFSDSDRAIVIAEDHKPWYTDRKRDIGDFYWGHYKAQLGPPKGKWDSHAIGVLDASIDDVISRLSDPTREEIYPVKGLVMGYVQSGKTSHFSGLITKAADAGYRMIIVLAGTLDILRRQTQRRIDKEIVGKELLGGDEYGGDTDWESFVAHGGLPSHLGAFDWERLTNRDADYLTLSRHLSILEFKAVDRTKPFNHPDNLRSATAKIAVLKKVPARINKVCSDLRDLKRLRSALEHVPTLIIDDESDQASINTIDQEKPGKKGERTSTNKAIGELLKLLPRAQYVGYTATPFANVFIDPDDAEDLFPKDFIVSLPRPAGYMGVSDFFDFDKEYADGNFRGNRNAFVRPVEGENDEPPNLPRAIDSFVLAGAIKLYREAQSAERYRFRHHTMLVHHSATRVVHEADRQIVATIYANGVRYQQKAGLEELRKLFDHDFVRVSKVRAPDDPFPRSFDELRPFISKCISKIGSDRPVRVVNGDDKHKDDTPDFEQSDVWAILIGGAKLSRGYTVEGLTVSYYRRPTGAGDTLMQMGRWFGFRPGYRDLVRLYIGRKEPKGKVTVDLYEAFGAVCRDEEALRGDLRKYSDEGLKPRQVPPLVQQHMPQLPPTSRNKMFNAEIRSRDFSGEWTEKTSAPTSTTHVKSNQNHAAVLLAKAKIGRGEKIAYINAKGEGRDFTGMFGITSGSAILQFLKGYIWADGRKSVSMESQFIEKSIADGKFDQWQIFMPQLKSGRRIKLRGAGVPEASVISRARVSETRFGVYSEPRHREVAAFMSGVIDLKQPSAAIKSRRNPQMPVLVFYFVEEIGSAKPAVSVGFGVQYPGQKKDKAITWMVRDRNNESAVVVAAVAPAQVRRK